MKVRLLLGPLEVHRDAGEWALLGLSWVEARLLLPGAVLVVIFVGVAKQLSARI